MVSRADGCYRIHRAFLARIGERGAMALSGRDFKIELVPAQEMMPYLS